MAKKKKVNPYRIPAMQGDIEKAKRGNRADVNRVWVASARRLRSADAGDIHSTAWRR